MCRSASPAYTRALSSSGGTLPGRATGVHAPPRRRLTWSDNHGLALFEVSAGR